MIKSFQSFTQSFIVSSGTGGPVDSTLFYTLYLYLKGFKSYDMGYAAAMAWVLLLIIAGLTGVNFLASKYWVFYGDDQVSAVPPAVTARFRGAAALLKRILLIAFGLVMLYPLLWMVSSSLKPEEQIFPEPGLCPSTRRWRTTARAGTRSSTPSAFYLWNSADHSGLSVVAIWSPARWPRTPSPGWTSR